MSQAICSQCGADIEGTGIRHRGRMFCSDECCEVFEEEYLTKGEPGLGDLDGEDLDDDEFEFDEDEFEDEDDLEDDDDGDEDDDDR